MKRNLYVLAVFIILFLLLSRIALTEVTNYDDEFNRAATLGRNEPRYTPSWLIKSTTEVLHKENMKTHAELEKLKKDVEELKKAVKEVKDIVEGGQ